MSRLFIVFFVFIIVYGEGMSKQKVKAYVDSLGFPKWYYRLKDVDKTKTAFIKILSPLIDKENQKILNSRAKTIRIFSKNFFEWSKQDIIFLAKTAKRYKINSIYNKKEFLKRVNIIPKNLVLAQAAIESGWGKSRFVKEANNIFGQWTFSDFGLVPNDRDKDKKHKLRVFKNLSSSIRAYMKNLNSNRAYKEFREARFVKKDHFDAFEAAKHLKRYSQLKDEYVKILTKTIKTIISHKAKR